MSVLAESLIVVGTSHHQSPLEFREKVSFLPDEHHGFLRRAHEVLRGGDCFLLSTCNRTEFYAMSPGEVAQRIRELLAEFKAIDLERDGHRFYELRGREAVLQLFRVASGLDSQMLGEPQILQQVKDTYETSRQANTAGVVGERLLEAAIRCGRRARAETDISVGAVSVAHAAVSLSHKVFADLAARTALVVGAGATAELVARTLRDHGIGRLLIANRTLERAQALAAHLQAEPSGLGELDEQVRSADIVITATVAPQPLLGPDTVRRIMKARQNRTLLLVDIGVPRNIAAGIREIENVFLTDIDQLQDMIDGNLQRRRREVPKVERIVVQEAQRFLDSYAGLRAGPAIKELRDGLEALRQQEMERHKHLTAEQRQAVDAVTHALLNKILHVPTVLLRDAAAQGDAGLRRIAAIREIFGIDRRQQDTSQPGDGDMGDGNA
jgi:glutamyl-tRNA reductase